MDQDFCDSNEESQIFFKIIKTTQNESGTAFGGNRRESSFFYKDFINICRIESAYEFKKILIIPAQL